MMSFRKSTKSWRVQWIGLVLALLSGTPQITAQSFPDIKPAPQQVAWQDLEFGVIIHFSTNTFLDREWGDGTADPSVFNPSDFNPDQWMKAIRDSGAKYVVLVAKHHDGFCLWPTEQTPYSLKSSPWQGGKVALAAVQAKAAQALGRPGAPCQGVAKCLRLARSPGPAAFPWRGRLCVLPPCKCPLTFPQNQTL